MLINIHFCFSLYYIINLITMLSYLHSVSCDLQGLLGDALLKERLDMDTLEMVGLVSSKTNFNQRYVKTKTKLLYVSSKYWGII